MKINFWPYVREKSSEDDGLDCYRRPFTLVDSKRAVWNVACDRVWIVAVRGKTCFPRFDGTAGDLNVLLSFIQSLPVNPQTVTVESLTKWTESGKKVRHVKGDDKVAIGQLFGAIIDLEKLAKLLQLLQSDRVKVWDSSAVARGPCLALGDERMRIFLMGHDPKAVKMPHVAVFDILNFEQPKPKFGVSPKEEVDDARFGFDLAMTLDDD